MEKKSPINPEVPPPTSNGGGNYKFLYWDDCSDELRELIKFNSINDTHTPENHPICKIKKKIQLLEEK